MTTKAIPRKDDKIGVRFTSEEKAALEKAAANRGMRLSEFVRHVLLREAFVART